ncbi:MAG: hypothetical protein KME45_03360 [Stenomitos rutilans HA7619-LM2]|jgi:hypothetical protein|nr:hypothetical protein [Stenomitos rutilans HA7619-LM2]MBW4469423.1 hypothetical protein [Stenomitos rutilans HA7619-LM2]
MTAVYATLRSQASNITFSAVSGGSLTGSGTLYFCAQLRSRAGLNLPTTPVSVSYTAGQRIAVTIASSAISAVEAGSAHAVVISAATTNDVTQMVKLGSFSLLQSDQITQVTLPQTFYLSTPAQIALAQAIATQASLPTGSDLLQGMVRQITAPTGGVAAGYYKYEPNATSGAIAASPNGYWVSSYPWIDAPNGFTTYIGISTDNPGGCDYPLQAVGSDALLLPAYNPVAGASTPLRIAIENGLTEDGGNSVEALSPIGMIVLANGVNLSAAFSGAIDVTYLGLARKSTGTLDTSDPNVGVNKTVTLFAGAANAQQNAQGNSTLSSYASTNLTFPQAVPRGYFALFTVRFNAQANKVSQFINGEDITLYLDAVGDVGEYSALAEAIGDTVLRYSDLPNDGYLRVLPAANSIVSQPGLGVFQGYIARRAGTRSASLSVADTAGQKVAIAGTSNGQIIVRQPSDTLLPTEALRTKVSTSPGTADATATGAAFSSAISVGTSGTLNIALTYPTSIRANYPDEIAGTTAPYNVPRLKVYLKVGGVITEQSVLITVTPGGGTQNIVVSANSGSTVGTLPTNADPAFCLFNAPSASGSAGTGGSLAAGSYQYAVVPHFPTGNMQATALSHKVSDGCVPEILTDLATAIGGAKGYTTLAASFVQPAVGGTVIAYPGVTDFFGVGQPVFVAGGGGYTLQSKTASALTLLRAIDNGSAYAATGGTVASGGLVVPGGQPGLTGATGSINGIGYSFSNAITGAPASGGLLLNNATPGSATTIRVSESDRLAASTVNFLNALTANSLLQLASDADKSVYHWYTYVSQVDNGTDRSLTVTYLFGNGSLVNASNVTVGLVLAGATGAAGTNGANGTNGTNGTNGVNAYTATTASFTQPASGSTVPVAVGSTAWMVNGEVLVVATGGYYSVASITDATHVVLTNLGYTGNASTSSTIASGSAISPGGVKGQDGTGAGTVTNFSAGDLYPFFTTTEATPTTTPALTFTLTKADLYKWNLFYG